MTPRIETLKAARIAERYIVLNSFDKMVPRGGIKPPTLRFSVDCSTEVKEERFVG
jgi:hypothetical protein